MFAWPAVQILWGLGGWGAPYPTPRQGTQTPCQRSAVPFKGGKPCRVAIGGGATITDPHTAPPSPPRRARQCHTRQFKKRARPAAAVRPDPRAEVRQAAGKQSLYEIQNLYIHARASAARFTHNVSKQGEQPREAPAVAPGGDAGTARAWRNGWRAIGAAVGPAHRAGGGVPGCGAASCPRA